MYHKVLYSFAGVSTSILIYDPQSIMFLLDVGDGITRDLLKEGIEFPLKVPLHIFITHGHYDHCGGLFSLLGLLRMLSGNQPVIVYYPADSKEVEGILNVFITCYSETLSYKLETQPLKKNGHVRINQEIIMKHYEMQHYGSTLSQGILSRIPALGFALYVKTQKWVAFTGDTGWSDHVIDLVKDSNHAYIEATNQTVKTPNHLNLKEANTLGKFARNYTLIHTKYDSR